MICRRSFDCATMIASENASRSKLSPRDINVAVERVNSDGAALARRRSRVDLNRRAPSHAAIRRMGEHQVRRSGIVFRRRKKIRIGQINISRCERLMHGKRSAVRSQARLIAVNEQVAAPDRGISTAIDGLSKNCVLFPDATMCVSM